MKLLLDTNVFIPLEPVASEDIEALSPLAMQLVRLAQEQQHPVYLHAKSQEDIARDKNESRRRLRTLEFGKYLRLEATQLPPEFVTKIGGLGTTSHDEVDNHLLYALNNKAVDILVTEDQGIHKKAKKLGFDDQVLTITDAINMLVTLYPRLGLSTSPHPVVAKVKCYSVDVKDRIFDSLRQDYTEFNDWYQRGCQANHRDCYVIKSGPTVDAICILKPEPEGYPGLPGTALKLSTFKVADHASGAKYGELLLHAAMKEAYAQNVAWVYLTVLKKQTLLCSFLERFGFRDIGGYNGGDENVFAKKICPSATDATMGHLDYHITFGPRYRHPQSPRYIVPIQPQFHDALFPELDPNPRLQFLGTDPFGNAIRKAYLCHSAIKTIEPGAQLFFYRSIDRKSIQTIGVVEGWERLDNPAAITRFVGKRTVYDMATIEKMCQKQVLAILFRQATSFVAPISRKMLEAHGVFSHPPQSICTISEQALEWLTSCQTL